MDDIAAFMTDGALSDPPVSNLPVPVEQSYVGPCQCEAYPEPCSNVADGDDGFCVGCREWDQFTTTGKSGGMGHGNPTP